MANIIKRIRTTLFQFRVAANKSGRSTLVLVLEWLYLKSARGKIGASEYLDFHLYRNMPIGQKLEFLGFRTEKPLDERLNKGSWIALVYDKLTFDALMRAANLRVPQIYCLYKSANRHHYSYTNCQNDSELTTYIVEKLKTPCFVKPLLGSFGQGCFIVESIDHGSQTLTVANHGKIGVPDFVNLLDAQLDLLDRRRARNGYLFQECLLPHPKIAEIFGPKICGLRLIVLKTDVETKLISAVWKIATGTSIVDNYNMGREGNWFASINLQDGKVDRVIKRTGVEESLVGPEDEEYSPLENFRIPEWAYIRQFCLDASSLFPRLWFQHWDIAITNGGPVAMECNTWGGLYQSQVANRKGIYTSELEAAAIRAKKFL